MSGWPIVYFEGSPIRLSLKYCISFPIDFVLANSAETDEILHFVVFHLDLHCLHTYLFYKSLLHIHFLLQMEAKCYQTGKRFMLHSESTFFFKLKTMRIFNSI